VISELHTISSEYAPIIVKNGLETLAEYIKTDPNKSKNEGELIKAIMLQKQQETNKQLEEVNKRLAIALNNIHADPSPPKIFGINLETTVAIAATIAAAIGLYALYKDRQNDNKPKEEIQK
jgi:hydrogenase maturation factor